MTMNEELLKIKERCTECGDCWMWQGACEGGQNPVMRGPGRTTVRVRRRVLELMGVVIGKKLAVSTCAEGMCVAPHHAQAWTRKRLQIRTAAINGYASAPVRRAKLAQSARSRSKVTLELVQQIRADSRCTREIAADVGLAKSTVISIKAGKTWRDYSNPFLALIR